MLKEALHTHSRLDMPLLMKTQLEEHQGTLLLIFRKLFNSKAREMDRYSQEELPEHKHGRR